MGTRPEIIKMAPIILELERRGISFQILHTGQHYHAPLSQVFFDEMGLPSPDHLLEVGSGTHAHQTARAMMRIEDVVINKRPHVLVAQGDTNTTLAAALVGVKLGIPVAHVEAGLRSNDLRMPEEHNRRLADHVCTLLFAPTGRAAKNLWNESVWGSVFITGNTVLDACLRYMPEAECKSKILESLPPGEFILATFHRAENVDDPRVLAMLVKTLTAAPAPVVFPIHPRTARRLKASHLFSNLSRSGNVKLLPPLGYFDFLLLMKSCRCILTDSGGIQEEATAPNIRKKVFVLRESTERPEAVEAGFAEVVGTQEVRVKEALEHRSWDVPTGTVSPFGDGFAARKIVDILDQYAQGATDLVPRLTSTEGVRVALDRRPL